MHSAEGGRGHVVTTEDVLEEEDVLVRWTRQASSTSTRRASRCRRRGEAENQNCESEPQRHEQPVHAVRAAAGLGFLEVAEQRAKAERVRAHATGGRGHSSALCWRWTPQPQHPRDEFAVRESLDRPKRDVAKRWRSITLRHARWPISPWSAATADAPRPFPSRAIDCDAEPSSVHTHALEPVRTFPSRLYP